MMCRLKNLKAAFTSQSKKVHVTFLVCAAYRWLWCFFDEWVVICGEVVLLQKLSVSFSNQDSK